MRLVVGIKDLVVDAVVVVEVDDDEDDIDVACCCRLLLLARFSCNTGCCSPLSIDFIVVVSGSGTDPEVYSNEYSEGLT